MKLIPKIENLNEKILVGSRLRMSLVKDKTFQLWSTFMPRRKEIKNSIDSNFYSMQIYDKNFNFQEFDLKAEFDKWAAIEVNFVEVLPDGMETFRLPGGLYAVFLHKGTAADGERTFRYIYGEWLPESGYLIDERPHFEILGEKYKNGSPDSEEEIWVPIKKKL